MAARNGFIKFDPDKIMETSAKLDQQHKRVVQNTASIKKNADVLMGSWQSESASAYLEKTESLHSESDKLAAILKTLSQNLAEASGIYRKGESDAKRETESLPTEGIF